MHAACPTHVMVELFRFTVLCPFVLGQREVLTSEEVEQLKSYLQTDMLWSELRKLFKTNSWATDSKLVSLLEVPLMRLCAGYLYLEKRRGYALDNVGKTDVLILYTCETWFFKLREEHRLRVL
jgi:hypothetical protein